MAAFKAFENLPELAVKYQNLLIENFQSGQQILTENAEAIVQHLLQKIAKGFGKLSARLSKPEVNLLYQLLQQQELATLSSATDVLWYNELPYRTISLKNPRIQAGEKYFQLLVQVKEGKIYAQKQEVWEPYTGEIRSSLGLPEKISFVILPCGELRLGNGHYYLAGNEPGSLLGAGVLRVREGKVTHILNDSNHFRPTRLEAVSSLRFLAHLGILHSTLKIDEVPITSHGG